MTGSPAAMWLRPMAGRDPTERHRAATPLELFFDLCFVVAVAQAAEGLHHGIADDHIPYALLGYVTVFFGIWWAWVNFTWFASAYDTDDVPYRVAALVQVVGVLILSAGVPDVFGSGDFGVVTLGYAVMRLALAAQWLRAARGDRTGGGRTARRYAAGISAAMIGWGALLVLPQPLRTPGFFVMVAVELAIPMWAERSGRTPWHNGHLAERHGLFTIIVLGESVLAATVAVQTVVDGEEATAAVVAGTILGAPLVVFAMWWIYFSKSEEEGVPPGAFAWGYGHYVILAAAAAVGAGIVVVVDEATEHAAIGPLAAASAVTVPVAVYLLSVWALHLRAHRERGAARIAFPVAAAAVLAATWAPEPVLVSGLVLSGLVVVHTITTGSAASWPTGPASRDAPADSPTDAERS